MGALVVALAVSCRSPTQIVIDARTNVVFRDGMAVTFTVGRPGETEAARPSTETRRPWGPDGSVGSLVVVPRNANDAPLAVKLVLGIGRDPRDCSVANPERCIIARRRLRYAPHDRLDLPVTLYAACEGVPCTEDSTCNHLGQCVDASVDPASCDGPTGCSVPGDPPLTDGGLAAPDGSIDATAEDATPDGASVDAADASEGGTGPTPGRVDCVSTSCDLSGGGTKCCYYPLEARGECIPVGSPCTGGLARHVLCDDNADCQAGSTCCATASAFACNSDCSGPQTAKVCHVAGQAACSASETCKGEPTGHYRTCSPP
ncbi:MAG: hypothetical protein KF819_35485 [Labilithrix sp.]|nr:hypothetical protein [Labilithrix sp.]